MKSSYLFQPLSIPHVFINFMLCFLISLALIRLQPVNAAPPTINYYVNITMDSLTNNSGCLDEADTDTCSLRGAIQLANAGDPSFYHHINLPAGTYTLSLPNAGENSNAYSDLDVYGPTTIIEGAGAASTVITQSGISDRIIDHQGDHSLQLIDLTIRDGDLPTGYSGGGIRSLDAMTLTLDGVRVNENTVTGSAAGDSGGGIYIDDTNLVITGMAQYYGNSACHGGGLRINNSGSGVTSLITGIIHYNVATCGNGGGIYTTGTVDLTLSSLNVSYNHALAGQIKPTLTHF
jgi:predicted outer membrane repeat protein